MVLLFFKRNGYRIVGATCFVFVWTSTSPASSASTSGVVTVEDVIGFARQDSETIKASDKTIESARSEIAARDLLLSPRISAELSDGRDHRDTFSSAGGRRWRNLLLETTLTKAFSTGTSLILTAGHEDADMAGTGERNIGSWETRLTQSLWRDAFGRGTDLRHESESAELRARILAALDRRQSFLINVEAVYWDLVLALKEEDIRTTNIERSGTLVNWTRDRVRRALAEPTDLLQAQALLSERQLDLASVQNRIETLRQGMRQLIPGQDPANWRLSFQDMETDRATESLLAEAQGAAEPALLSSLAAVSEAARAGVDAKREDDTRKPQLDAFVSYGQNGIDERFSTAWDRARDPEFSAARVGVLFSMDLDFALKNESRAAAQANAAARDLEARAATRSSSIEWNDLNRRIESLRRQVESAKRLADIQEKKIEAELRRFRLGRTTIFQLISFEVDASEARLQQHRLAVELRKTESRARLFTRDQGSAL